MRFQKVLWLVFFLAAGAGGSAGDLGTAGADDFSGGDPRFEPGLAGDLVCHVPYRFRLKTGEESLDEMMKYAFLVPEGDLYYFWGGPAFHAGPGVRVFSLILESLAVPVFCVESDLGPLRLQGRVGGGGLLLFGLYNDFVTGPGAVADVSASFMLTETFSIGTSANFLVSSESENIQDNYMFIGTVMIQNRF